MGDHGAFMDPELRLPRDELAGQIRALGAGRHLIAIAGAPGSGKSHLAAELAAQLNADAPDLAAAVPMDGVHLSNEILDAQGLRARKGAPETFDLAGFSECLAALRAGGADQAVPLFDRDADRVLPDAGRVPQAARFILIEGNYLLLTRAAWRDLFPLFDLSVRLDVAPAELRARLEARWQAQGLTPSDIAARVAADMDNAILIARENRGADFVIRD